MMGIEKRPSLLMEWLGLGAIAFQQRETMSANGFESERFSAGFAPMTQCKWISKSGFFFKLMLLQQH